MKLSCLFLEAKKILKHVGIFVKLPENLASKFKRNSEDTSKPHVTVLYLGDKYYSDEDSIVAAAYEIAKTTSSFNIKFGELGYFEHDDQTVAFTKVDSDGLRTLRTALVRAMKKHKVKWEDKWGKYNPHITLDYLKCGDTWEEKIPSGSWTCKELEVWGFDKKHIIKFEG